MGFTVSFMLSRHITKYMYEPMLNKRKIDSLVVCCRPFPSEMVFIAISEGTGRQHTTSELI